MTNHEPADLSMPPHADTHGPTNGGSSPTTELPVDGRIPELSFPFPRRNPFESKAEDLVSETTAAYLLVRTDDDSLHELVQSAAGKSASSSARPRFALESQGAGGRNFRAMLESGSEELIKAVMNEKRSIDVAYLQETARTQRQEAHQQQMLHAERERTKRMSVITAAAMLIAAGLLQVVVPSGRETAANWFGLALTVASAGMVGFAVLRAELPKVRVEAGGRPPNP